MVGSTEFKQASRGAGASREIADAWVEPFLSFYQISVEQMEAQWTRICSEMRAIEPSNKSERFVLRLPARLCRSLCRSRLRLREHATPRQLVVSADLVWLLCHSHDSCTDRERKRCRFLAIPHIGYDGRRGLKGILGGKPYPLLWIEADPDNGIDRAEDDVLRRLLSGHTPDSDRVEHISHYLFGRTT